MITVTKLKATVKNKTLPILTENGELSDYNVGRYRSALASVGYSLSKDKENALSDFIQSGKDNGWLYYIKYFMPFIGNSDSPIAGVIPAIDETDLFDTSYYSNNWAFDKMFEYDSNGDITNYGTSPKARVPLSSLKIPIGYKVMNGFGYSIGVKNDIREYSDNVSNWVGALVSSVSEKFSYGIRMGVKSNGKTTIERVTKFNGDVLLDDLQYNALLAYRIDDFLSSFDLGGYTTFSMLSYIKNGKFRQELMYMSNDKRMHNSIYDSKPMPSMIAAEEYSIDSFAVSSHIGENQPTDAKLSHLALIDASINSATLDAFNKDVYHLMVALGRAV